MVGRDKFSKAFAGTLVNVLGMRARPREQRGSGITARVIFRIDDGIDIGPVRQ